jgi:cysteine-rich repeat protein
MTNSNVLLGMLAAVMFAAVACGAYPDSGSRERVDDSEQAVKPSGGSSCHGKPGSCGGSGGTGGGSTCSYCGDGVLDAGEECDDGAATASCDSDCSLASCGDGLVNAFAGEDCDTIGSSAGCDFDCTFSICGDGVLNSLEEACDDGNDLVGDGCVRCQIELLVCGNGVVEAGEACDTAGASPTCDADCTAVSCGDGVVNPSAGEQCDTTFATATCDDDCTVAFCGDGMLNTVSGEACDAAGMSAICDYDCTIPHCGDGVVNHQAGEVCDDANTGSGDGCFNCAFE